METITQKTTIEDANHYCKSLLYLVDSPQHNTIVYTIHGGNFKKNTFENELYSYSLELMKTALYQSSTKYKNPLIQVHIDLKGITMKHIDYNFFKRFIHTFQSFEDDVLDKLIITNIPIFFKVCYKVLKPFIDKDVRKKIFFEKKKKDKVQYVNRDEDLFDE